jgi:hypothetical protein
MIFNTGGKCAAINLFEIIKYGLIEKKLKAFGTDQFSKTQIPLTESQLLQMLSRSDTSDVATFDANGTQSESREVTSRYLLGGDIKTYVLKEDWVFNSLTGKTEKFIIGLAPVVYDEKSGNTRALFWLYYPEWRELFSVFEARNYYSYSTVSFHDLFMRRYFISQISKASNVFDRKIGSVHHGYDAVLESERIKEKMHNAESDLFEH